LLSISLVSLLIGYFRAINSSKYSNGFSKF